MMGTEQRKAGREGDRRQTAMKGPERSQIERFTARMLREKVILLNCNAKKSYQRKWRTTVPNTSNT